MWTTPYVITDRHRKTDVFTFTKVITWLLQRPTHINLYWWSEPTATKLDIKNLIFTFAKRSHDSVRPIDIISNKFVLNTAADGNIRRSVHGWMDYKFVGHIWTSCTPFSPNIWIQWIDWKLAINTLRLENKLNYRNKNIYYVTETQAYL